MDFFDIYQSQVAIFLLILTRVSGIFIIAPFFGSLNIPMQMRVAVALSIAVILYPLLAAQGIGDAPPDILGYGMAVVKELFVGWLIGFVAYISFSAIHMAGKIMDMQVGFAMANVIDPTSGQQIPLIGSFLYNLALMVFLVTDGHHIILGALVESFQSVPPLTLVPNLSLTTMIAQFTGVIFQSGMKIAMPVTFAILLVNVGLGILARTMPQLNIFVVGIPIQLGIGLTVLSMILPFFVLFLDVLFDEMYGNISLVLQALQ